MLVLYRRSMITINWERKFSEIRINHFDIQLSYNIVGVFGFAPPYLKYYL
jgi:hypothetical protein